jgi:hypothetical protein
VKRDTVSAFRARAKKTNDEIAATLADVNAESRRRWREERASERLAELERVPLTRDDIVGAKVVRTAIGWQKVRTVNKVTVSVESGYSWADKIPFDKVLEVRR